MNYEAGKTRTMQKVAAFLANKSGTLFAVRSSESSKRSGAQTNPIFGPSPSLFIHIHVDVTDGKKPYYPPGPPPVPMPPRPPPAPSSMCINELKKMCNTSAGKKPCERCCKHEINRLNQTGIACTKAEREAVCKHHGTARAASTAPPLTGPPPQMLAANACAQSLVAHCKNASAAGKDACESCCKAEINADEMSVCQNKTSAMADMKHLCNHHGPDRLWTTPTIEVEDEWWRQPQSQWGMAPWDIGSAKDGKLTPPELIAIVNATLQYYRYISIGQNALGAVKSGYNSSAFQSQCGESGIALFLMAVEPGCVLMCNGWSDEYAHPLGMPQGPASYDAATWTWRRDFASGTSASWCNGSGTINWVENH